MQETSATKVCVSTFSFYLQEKGVRLGLVVEGEDGRLGLALMMIHLRLHIPFSIGVSSQTGKRQALMKCVNPHSVSASWSRFGHSSIHSKFLTHCLIDRKGRALLRRAHSSLPDWWKGARPLDKGALKFAWLIERGAPSWKGRAQVCLIDGKVRAPVDQGAPKENGTIHYWELTDSAYSIQMV